MSIAGSYSSMAEMLQEPPSPEPVYCIYPQVYERVARDFVEAFSGRVLYAVKANDHPYVIELLRRGGVSHFDCASLPEIETVRRACPDARCYFMTPDT